MDEMNECILDHHNEMVKPKDKFYHLGDVCFNVETFRDLLPKFNGKKRLIMGNHDNFKMSEYLQHFEKVMESWHPVRNILFTHRPVLLSTEWRKNLCNVHGHIHKGQIGDKRYLNISVEETDFRPVHYEDILKKFREKGVAI